MLSWAAERRRGGGGGSGVRSKLRARQRDTPQKIGNWRFGVPRSTKWPVGFYVESGIPDFLRSVPNKMRGQCPTDGQTKDSPVFK